MVIFREHNINSNKMKLKELYAVNRCVYASIFRLNCWWKKYGGPNFFELHLNYNNINLTSRPI